MLVEGGLYINKVLKNSIKIAFSCVVVVLVLLVIFNPNRGSFNNAVFENYSNPITENHEIMDTIRETNRKDYNNESHPFVQGKNYFLFSIYDVHADDGKVYHILGIFQTFKLLNP